MKEKTQKETLREKLSRRKKVMGLKVPDVNLILSLLKSKDKNIKLFNSCQKKYCIRFKTKKSTLIGLSIAPTAHLISKLIFSQIWRET